MHRYGLKPLPLLILIFLLAACGGQTAPSERFSSVDPAARLTTFVEVPEGWVAQSESQVIQLASSEATLAKLQAANAGFEAGEGAILINRLPAADVAGYTTPFEVYQALRAGSTIGGATIVAEVQGDFGDNPAVKAQIQSVLGSGFVYVTRVGSSYFLVLSVAQSAGSIQQTGDAVVTSLAVQPGDAASFSITIAETETTYTQETGFALATDIDGAPALRFVNLGEGGTVALRLAEGSALSAGEYPLTVTGFPTVTVPVADGRVLACTGLSAGTLTLAGVENSLLSGSFTLTATDCVLRAFPSQEVLSDAPPFETLTLSGTFSDVPLPTSLSGE